MYYRVPKIPKFRHAPAVHGGDYLSEQGAQTLAKVIEERWHSAGHPSVKAWVVATPTKREIGRKRNTVYEIKTNLVAGLPPRF